ncbi:MAG: CHASE2 domain-containing protein [Sterolibacterium sp.]
MKLWHACSSVLRRPSFWLALCVAAAVELASGAGWFGRIETTWEDMQHRLAGVRHWPSHVALVVIDDASLNQYKDDPLAFWTPHLARASARLREVGAAAVGIDFLFSVSPEAWLARLLPADSKIARTYDGPLRAEINSGQVVLVSSHLFDPKTGYDQLLLPDASFLMAVPDFDFPSHVGLANLLSDNDGVVRRFVIAPTLHLPPGTDPAQLPRYSLAPLLAARAASLDKSRADWELASIARRAADELHRIVYSGPPGTIPRITLSRLLSDTALSDPVVQDLRGKAVILGGEFLSMGDVHLTPYGTGGFAGSGAIMTGAEVQANIIETLLAGLVYRPFPGPAHFVLALLFAASGVSLWSARGALRMAGLAAMLGLALLISYSAFVRFLLLPVVPLVAALLLTFGGCALLANSPARRHEARLRAALGAHLGEENFAWLAAARQMLPAGWELFPAAVLALVLPPAEDVADFERLLALLREKLRSLGATVSAGEGQLLLAYFGWPRPTANPSAEALAAVQSVSRLLSEEGVTNAFGIGLHVGETAFRVDRGTLLAAGESVAAAAGLAHQSLHRNGRTLASVRLMQAACPEKAAPLETVVWQNGAARTLAAEVET